MKTPVALIVFNRPDATARVIKEIAKVKPAKLLVVADGPRSNNSTDIKNCHKVRKIIKKFVDWPCEVLTNYSDNNLGCKIRVATGLDWVFSKVEEAIILEDDCIPQTTFFRFCEELLDEYRDNDRVSIISGSNLFISRKKSPDSYYFSVFPQAWGWATWKRFWVNYDVGIKQWPVLKNSNWLETILKDNDIVNEYWTKVFDLTYQNKTGTWDYQLVFASWIKNQLAVIPSVNMVSNIGFGQNSGTHFTKWHKWQKFADLKSRPIQFPLSHPVDISENKKADKFIKKYSFTYFRPFPVKVLLYIGLWLKRLTTEPFL